MPASPLGPLRAAAAAMESVIEGIGPAQWSAPTPCPAWTVADLTDHVVAGNRRFASAVAGEPALVDELYEAFAAAGALDRVVSVPFGRGAVAVHLRVVELVVHGWDLARATDPRIVVPDDVVRAELEFTRQALPRVPADRLPFGPPQPAWEAAGALDEFVALLGRTV